MPDLWICPDPDCDGYATGSDIERVTCTRRVPHLQRRGFPDMVPVARLKREAAIAPLAAEAVRLSGNRSCRDGEPPVPHLNPQAFAKLASAIGAYDAERRKEPSDA